MVGSRYILLLDIFRMGSTADISAKPHYSAAKPINALLLSHSSPHFNVNMWRGVCQFINLVSNCKLFFCG